MAIQAVKGPYVGYGAFVPNGPASGLGVAQDYNPDRSPSIFDQGVAIMDPRPQFAYAPGGASTGQGTRGAYGWLGANEVVIVDQVPSTISTTNIAAAAAPTISVPMTLVAATGGGITVATSITNQSTGATVTGLLAIDTAFAAVQPGVSGGNLLWDPTKAISRAVSLTSASDLSGVNFTIRGYDLYGFPMTQTLAGPNANTVNTTKAFKYIASVTPSATNAATVSVGTSDIIGLMLRSDRFQYLKIYFPDTTLISASTGYVAADTTSPATVSTGDVRGTYALQTASNNTRRLIITARVALGNISTTAGLVGVTQV